MWDVIVSVPDHYLSFYFTHNMAQIMCRIRYNQPDQDLQ